MVGEGLGGFSGAGALLSSIGVSCITTATRARSKAAVAMAAIDSSLTAEPSGEGQLSV